MSPTSTPSTTVDLMSTTEVETTSLDALAVAPEQVADIALEIPVPAASVLAPEAPAISTEQPKPKAKAKAKAKAKPKAKAAKPSKGEEDPLADDPLA